MSGIPSLGTNVGGNVRPISSDVRERMRSRMDEKNTKESGRLGGLDTIYTWEWVYKIKIKVYAWKQELPANRKLIKDVV